ncbi:cytochrome P450 3A4-like isoform X2 [Amblyomma americanum]
MTPHLVGIVASVAVVLAAAVVLFAVRRRRILRSFKDLGIPGPKPDIIWGNLRQITHHRLATLMEWKKQYGAVFGIYMGIEPFLVITDPDMVQECFVKQAAIFQDRPIGFVDAEPFKSSLFQLNGSSWKNVRAALNYAFSSNVIKELSSAAILCSSRFVDAAARTSRTNGHAEVFELAMGLSFDFIMKAVLAQKASSQGDSSEPILQDLKQVCKDMENSAIEVAFTLPGVRALLTWVYPLTRHARAFKDVRNLVRSAVELHRSGDGAKECSILQVLLDARAEGDVHHRPNKRHLDDRYIVSNGVIFLLAGFETTATTLSFLAYLLAKHPSEQDEIVKEFGELFPRKAAQDLSFDELRQLRRLDWTVLEGLRLYPPVPVSLARKCSRDTTVCGQFIPAGVNILAAPWLLHYDPDLWPEPEQFRPDRFAEENRERVRSGSYVPFGLGPRVCIGEKLAVLIVKSALIQILQDFRLTLRGEEPSSVVADHGFVLIPEGVKIRLEQRATP